MDPGREFQEGLVYVSKYWLRQRRPSPRPPIHPPMPNTLGREFEDALAYVSKYWLPSAPPAHIQLNPFPHPFFRP